MKIGENKFVSIAYALSVDGTNVETVTADKPLEFVFGAGLLLPSFEKHLAGKAAGDKFKFSLAAADAYGELIPEAVVELPKEVFMIDGAIEDGLLDVGNQLPMSDNQGNRMMGTIVAVDENTVKMDFNHPMAGKALDFQGEVVGVREATAEDMAKFQGAMGGGCDCGCDDCSDGCECDDEKSCGCECN